jgi:hypothetical protein
LLEKLESKRTIDLMQFVDDSTNASCAYVQYCGYHGAFSLNGQPVIYANIPYGNPTVCAGTQTFPNDPPGDVAANITSHDIMESTTDPLLNAWFDSSGNEIGDICLFNYGTNTWDGGQSDVERLVL